MSDGKEFHKLMCTQKKVLNSLLFRPKEEISLAPEDNVYIEDDVNTAINADQVLGICSRSIADL